MHLYRNALYRTKAGNLFRYCGVVPLRVYGKVVPILRFSLVKQRTALKCRQYVEFPVRALQNPGSWLRNLTLVGRNYVPKK